MFTEPASTRLSVADWRGSGCPFSLLVFRPPPRPTLSSVPAATSLAHVRLRPHSFFPEHKVVQAQLEPETRIGASVEELRELYCAQQRRDAPLNSVALRTVGEAALTVRVLTYNVHMWVSVDGRAFTTDALLENVRTLAPDVLVLNESNCCFDDEPWDESDFTPADSRMAALYDMGFVYLSVQRNTKDREFINMVYSRHPMRDVHIHHLPGDSNFGERYAIECIIDAPHGCSFRLFATHLDVFDDTEETRVLQARRLIELARAKAGVAPTAQIIAGDFNALRRSDYSDVQWDCIVRHDAKRGVTAKHACTDVIEEAGFVDCFAAHNVPPPLSTTWSGRRIDYIYLSPHFPLRIRGCFVYHDAASDHIPVMCDFFLPDC